MSYPCGLGTDIFQCLALTHTVHWGLGWTVTETGHSDHPEATKATWRGTPCLQPRADPVGMGGVGNCHRIDSVDTKATERRHTQDSLLPHTYIHCASRTIYTF